MLNTYWMSLHAFPFLLSSLIVVDLRHR